MYLRTVTAVAFAAALFGFGQLSGQVAGAPDMKEKNIRIRAGAGFAMLSGTRRLKDHYSEYGFNQTTSVSVPLTSFTSSTEYPEDEGLALVGELGVDYQLSPQSWLGLVIGSDNWVNVKGYNGKAVFGREHWSLFLSPQYSKDVSGYNFGFFVGPTLDLHFLSTKAAEGDVARKKLGPGALGGFNIYMGKRRRTSFFAAFRWSPKQHYDALASGQGAQMTTLPEADISFSYLRIGVSYGRVIQRN